MAQEIDIRYNSITDRDAGFVSIASGHISKTTILFENEHLLAVVEATGHVTVCDMEGTPLATVAVPAEESGRQVYEQVCCGVEDGALLLRFPICEWIDNYPHCDGEHDRWATRIVGYHTLTYRPADNSISAE